MIEKKQKKKDFITSLKETHTMFDDMMNTFQATSLLHDEQQETESSDIYISTWDDTALLWLFDVS